MLASFLSTRANERSNPTGLLFSFVGGVTFLSSRALPPVAAESGSHIRPKSVGELAHQWQGRDIFAEGRNSGIVTQIGQRALILTISTNLL